MIRDNFFNFNLFSQQNLCVESPALIMICNSRDRPDNDRNETEQDIPAALLPELREETLMKLSSHGFIIEIITSYLKSIVFKHNYFKQK